MSDESFDRLFDLPDAEIEKYLPAGVPLRLFEEPTERLESPNRSIAQLHRTMLVCHARVCAALDALAESRRGTAAQWERGLAKTKQFIEPTHD